MVNIGGPSRGCEQCKKRKIKCDEKRPYCDNCSRSKRQCSGVPDPETLFLSRLKHRRKEGRRPRASASSQGRVASPGPRYLPKITPELILSNQAQAVAFFFRNYVAYPIENMLMDQHWPVLVPLYREASVSSAVQAATDALALDTLAFHTSRQELRSEAAIKYSEALGRVRGSLVHSTISQCNDVLQAGQLLLVYELYNGRALCLFEGLRDALLPDIALDPQLAHLFSPHDLEGSLSHIQGAMSLLRSHHALLLSDIRSRELARIWKSSHVLPKLLSSTSLHVMGKDLEWFVHLDIDGEDPNIRLLTKMSYRVATLRLEFRNHLAHELSNVTSAIERFFQQSRIADGELSVWFESLPSEWYPYEDDSTPGSSDEYGSLVPHSTTLHMYNSVGHAHMLNIYRVLRIQLLQIQAHFRAHMQHQQRHHHHGSTHSKRQPEDETAVATRLCDDIFASVPFTMGYRSEGAQEDRDEMAWRRVGAANLLWILSNVFATNMLLHDHVQRIRAMLRTLIEDFGVSLTSEGAQMQSSTEYAVVGGRP